MSGPPSTKAPAGIGQVDRNWANEPIISNMLKPNMMRLYILSSFDGPCAIILCIMYPDPIIDRNDVILVPTALIIISVDEKSLEHEDDEDIMRFSMSYCLFLVELCVSSSR
mmetsp:Transcript_9371/g.13887  ORF Transcript_9371/g.13887 Transcript_9371/m.13887 type:complete len:111 (+) Transcript_9371:994-1326(+)